MVAVNRCYGLTCWFNPIAAGAYQVNQFVNRAFCGDIAFDDVFALVERDFARSTAYITVIGVGHFTGTVDNAAHNANFDAFEVVGVASNQGGGFLKVEQGAPARRAGYVFGFGDAGARGLQDAEGRAGEGVIVYLIGCIEPQAIAEAIDEQSSAVCGGVEHEGVIG